MKIHRFFVDDIELSQSIWVHKPELLKQWIRVLRFRPGQRLVLFDGKDKDRLYELVEIKPDETRLELITEFERKLPGKDIYLFWSLLKKDKNDWVIQKGTELGASHFVPILADRSEKTGFNLDRAKKIAIEASEQCGRSDIPSFREPLGLESAISQYIEKVGLFVCEQSSDTINTRKNEDTHKDHPTGVIVGPEGGWTDTEKKIFETKKIEHINLHDFTLRAETACVAAISQLMSN